MEQHDNMLTLKSFGAFPVSDFCIRDAHCIFELNEKGYLGTRGENSWVVMANAFLSQH